MNPDWNPAYERAATLAFDKRASSAQLDTWQKATERKPPEKSTGTSLLLRFLYWIYERRLLAQLKQRPMPRHIGIILDGNRRHARKRGLNDPCEIYQRGAETAVLAADKRSACRAEIPNVITAAAMGLYQEARARIGQSASRIAH